MGIRIEKEGAMKKWLIPIILLLLLILPLTRIVPSVGIMSLNNLYHKRSALTQDKNIELDFPVGRVSENQNWFPMMLTFNASEDFSRYFGREIDLTILYNFGAYKFGKSYSSFYDEESPYFGAFYGAYLVEDSNNPHGFGILENGKTDSELLFNIAKYDYTRLVLSGLGAKLTDVKFEQVLIGESIRSIVGYDDWIQIDAVVKTNGPIHAPSKFQVSYLQYGYPPKYGGENFPEVDMHSRVWTRRFPEKSVTIVFYVMTPDLEFLNDMSERLIYETNVTLN